MEEPLSRYQALKLARSLVEVGKFSYSPHSLEELAADKLDLGDALNIIRAGVANQEPEMHKGSWRYKIETPRMVAVIAFRGGKEVRFVTAWRKK